MCFSYFYDSFCQEDFRPLTPHKKIEKSESFAFTNSGAHSRFRDHGRRSHVKIERPQLRMNSDGTEAHRPKSTLDHTSKTCAQARRFPKSAPYGDAVVSAAAAVVSAVSSLLQPPM